MRILIDLDDVLADFDGGFKLYWRKLYGEAEMPQVDGRELFYIAQEEDASTRMRVYGVINSPGFYRDLSVVEGGKEALEYMTRDHEIFLVTSPGENYYNSPSEKYAWVKEQLGAQFHERLIITRSKYTVSGDILIDDKPSIAHENAANWEHILFDRSYNRKVESKQRLNWNNYKEVLGI